MTDHFRLKKLDFAPSRSFWCRSFWWQSFSWFSAFWLPIISAIILLEGFYWLSSDHLVGILFHQERRSFSDDYFQCKWFVSVAWLVTLFRLGINTILALCIKHIKQSRRLATYTLSSASATTQRFSCLCSTNQVGELFTLSMYYEFVRKLSDCSVSSF